MKFSITGAFLVALTFRAVAGRRIGSAGADDRQLEDAEFWNTFADERFASMAEPVDPVPGEVISDAPSDGPSLNAFSIPPSDGPSLNVFSTQPSDGPSLNVFSTPPSDGPSVNVFSTVPVAVPTAIPSDTCQSITEVVCSLPEFEILCALVGDAGLADTLGGEDEITLFAPINDAFEALPLDLADEITTDLELLNTVLLSHAVPGFIFSTDLECGGEISMVSGAETTTICTDGNIFQTGAGNMLETLPQIIAPDGEACNGVIHAINQVILTDLDR